MALKQAKRLNEDFIKTARSLGLLDQKHFREALESYQFTLELIAMLRAQILKEGTTMMVPVGSKGDVEKAQAHFALKEIREAEKTAQALRKEMDKKIEDAMKTRAEVVDDEDAAGWA